MAADEQCSQHRVRDGRDGPVGEAGTPVVVSPPPATKHPVVLATTVIQSEISMALPVIAAASTTPRLYPTKIPSFLPRSAGTISDWTSER